MEKYNFKQTIYVCMCGSSISLKDFDLNNKDFKFIIGEICYFIDIVEVSSI